MSGYILCQTERAEAPYFIENISMNIYSLEELCYYLDHNLYLIDQGKIRLHEDTDVLLDQYGILKVTESEFAALDKQYILAYCKEDFGYCCLTDQKQYYMENMPQIVIEKGTIDEVMKTMLKGSSRKGVSL